MISVGGAVGAALVGIAAPLTLPGYHELELSLLALAAIATWLGWGLWNANSTTPKWMIYSANTLAIVLCGFTLGRRW